MHCVLPLPARSDVSSVMGLREEWLAKIDQQTEVQIDCAALETVSAAAAQLVLALAKSLATVGGTVSIIHLKEAQREDFALLGLKEFI